MECTTLVMFYRFDFYGMMENQHFFHQHFKGEYGCYVVSKHQKNPRKKSPEPSWKLRNEVFGGDGIDVKNLTWIKRL